jgi:hypothetical protein
MLRHIWIQKASQCCNHGCSVLRIRLASSAPHRAIWAGAGGIERRLDQLELTLPADPKLPPGVTISFEWIRIRGNRAFVSGHGPLAPDGSPVGPYGKVPSEVPLEAAQQSARLTALAVIAGLKRAIGDLDRIAGWAVVNGFVNADPGYAQTTLVLNPFSDLILDAPVSPATITTWRAAMAAISSSERSRVGRSTAVSLLGHAVVRRRDSDARRSRASG